MEAVYVPEPALRFAVFAACFAARFSTLARPAMLTTLLRKTGTFYSIWPVSRWSLRPVRGAIRPQGDEKCWRAVRPRCYGLG